ncbi:polyribonucleotide nucleotidyltransferase [Buchnera aphidicola]|uniref:polyribonucleotide nucleotidyltransferase n=1 Tax=Buchnera aphidicola TaxID=9 RepID=UPI002238929F|nr:polyribonucleotide nucleotidyltransferase [Buchnera aphidicola]MCW5197586.1 polyribonucleotide nucleotidyltransferase [Buchnera aphidicola (Chaitophorus viminalis)]
MLNPFIFKFKYGNHIVTLETGLIARQATSSIMASIDDTSVLVTVVAHKEVKEIKDFLPLTVNYQERTYAAGKIPGGFFRREGRPSENEILIGRLIDRPIRAIFPKNFYNEVQVIVTVVSLNPKINPDIVSMIGVSAALYISGIPVKKMIGAARIGLINNKYVLNPTTDEMKFSLLDLIVSGTDKNILMLESESDQLDKEIIFKGILYGFKKQRKLIKSMKNLLSSIKKKNWKNYSQSVDDNLYKKILNLSKKKIKKYYCISDKKKRFQKLKTYKSNIISKLLNQDLNINILEVNKIFYDIEKKIVRKNILIKKKRIDGRSPDVIRNLDIKTSVLSRTHGSSLFTRGETQSLVSVTLGTSRDAQNLDELLGDKTDSFLFHYNFPPYSVGEIGMINSPKRREVGHGKLAKKSILAVMPSIEIFPYTIRIVSEITESNGSSSMASVCGASLALMDAGVPIKQPIAGVAMGLIKKKNNYVILTDILGDEDHFGDMDFKISGSIIGITALQLDMKTEGMTYDILHETLDKSCKAINFILNVMSKTINTPNKEISKFAPRVHVIKINPEKIKDVIGKGGSIIRMLTEETGTIIEIEDNGTVKISAVMEEKAEHAIKRIQEITSDLEIGKIYTGKVTRIVDFGAFISIGIGKEGLVHISQISEKHIEKVSDYLKLNQIVKVKVLDIDRQKRLRLSMKKI